MAAIQFRAATSIQGNASSGANQALTLPTSLPGDLVILLVSFIDAGDTLTLTGQSNFFNYPGSVISGGIGVTVYSAVVFDNSYSGATTNLVFTGTTDKYAAIAASYSGVYVQNAFLNSTPQYAQFTTSNTTSATSPSFTLTGAPQWGLEFFCSKSTTNTSYTTPSGLTSRQQIFGTGGGAADLALFDSNGPVTSIGGHTSTMGTATASKIAGTIVLDQARAPSINVQQAVNRAAVF